MLQPKSQKLGSVVGPDGETYDLWFYGESEMAAVINDPVPPTIQLNEPMQGMRKVLEKYREPAENASDAYVKLRQWMRNNGWPMRRPPGQRPVSWYKVQLANGTEE